MLTHQANSRMVKYGAATEEIAPGGRIATEELDQQLAIKRKALDKEIERFMALKDAEYRRFEKDLRGQLQQPGSQKISSPIQESPTIVAKGFSVASFLQTPHPLPEHPLRSQDTIEDHFTGIHQPNGRQPPLLRTSSQEDSRFELGVSFAPGYLSLLEGTASHKGHGKALSTGSASLSSSLTNQSAGSDNEIPPPDRRSSSSPTGRGFSTQKSSLKKPTSPDSGPRERKHVLFSIDNHVISPSSSPVAARLPFTKHPPIPFSGLRDLSTIDLTPSPNTGSVETTVSPSKLNSASLSKSYRDLVEPTVTTPPEELEHEDLHLASRDPLFDVAEPPPPLDDEEWNSSPVERRSVDEEETLSSSLPVGSVPIDIRGPSRA